MNLEIRQADYSNSEDARAIGDLLNDYASHPMGGGAPLPGHVRQNVATELSKLPYAFTLLSHVDGEAAGLVNCFELFSTFSCKPLLNIHDIVVAERHRGKGISQKMLAAVEAIAREKGCCKITLEVLQGNAVAKHAYRKFGFDGYELDPAMGRAEFWQKLLS